MLIYDLVSNFAELSAATVAIIYDLLLLEMGFLYEFLRALLVSLSLGELRFDRDPLYLIFFYFPVT